MGQGRKPKPKLLALASSCPHCGSSLAGLQLDAKIASGSFGTRRNDMGELEIVYFDDDARPKVSLSETEVLRRGGAVDVSGERGILTGFSRDRASVYVRFASGARKVPVEDVTPVR